MNESSYLADEHAVFDSDMDGSVSGGGSRGSQMGNVYTVEHLATFGLSQDLAFPADGMRRLLHMEKAGFGIWSQKMRIRLEYQFIVILDFENGNEMERFPLHLIRNPTAFTNPNPGELYNNIVAFVVDPTEMHIFQCFDISAQDIVEDIKMALSGRLPPMRQRHGSQNSLPPPPVNPPPEPPTYPEVRQGVNDEGRDEDASSVESEGSYDREVAILNRCFDDIERFIARLQYAAAAHRELLRRRKSKKNKKKDHGEGLLSMRAKPPHEREFVDILQKFKLSFNLLARLKSHIHDPNAPELVHFLFTPLALIVDASRDAHRAGLATQVVSPLLSPGAIELLNNCLSSKETELWHSLGEAWLKSRDQWKGYVAPYQPVFMDGWSPTIPESNLAHSFAAEAKLHVEEMRVKRSALVRPAEPRERSVSPVDMMGDDFTAGQKDFLDSVRLRGGKIVVVTHHRTANNHKELTVVRGEYLEVLDDTKKWWKARNWKNQVAHVPHTIVSSPNGFPPETDGYHGMDNGRGGRQLSPPSSVMSSEEDRGSRGNSVPKTPPPPPPPQPREESKSPSRYGSSSPSTTRSTPSKDLVRQRDADEMQEELRNVLLIYRTNRPKIEIKRTPEVYISRDSTVSEVHEWLKAKDFSDRVIRALTGMNGSELFALKRDQLVDICGKEEGGRLFSQITLSRNVKSADTVRRSELRAVLARVRAKADAQEDDEVDSKEDVKWKKTTEKNTLLNSMSKPPKEMTPMKEKAPVKSLESRRDPRDALPLPPPLLPPKSSSKTNLNKQKPHGSNKFVHSRYDPDSSDGSDSSHEDSDDDGTSMMSTLVRRKQREMLQRKS